MKKELLIISLIIGLGLGGGAGWFLSARTNTPKPQPKSSIPAGWKSVSLPEVGLRFITRETDQITRLKHEDKQIGYEIFDPYAAGGARVDIITNRVAEFYDRPEATSLGAYKEAIEGLTIQETREATVHGHPALKQLYTAVLGQKRSDGAIIKRPASNLLRYVFAGDNQSFILLKSSASNQKFLDTIALSLEFIPISTSSSDGASITVESENDIDVNPSPVSTDLFEQENGITIQ